MLTVVIMYCFYTVPDMTNDNNSINDSVNNSSFHNKCNECLKCFWTNAFDWGRATRKEFWISWLVYHVFANSMLFVASIDLNVLYSMITAIPNFTLIVRRLHDTNRSGWNMLWMFLPIIGWAVFFVFLTSMSDASNNRFGRPRIVNKW